MSFKNLKKEELLYAAEFFNVTSVTDDNTKPEIVAALEEAEITWANYKKFAEADGKEVTDEGDVVTPEPKTISFSDNVLLKMDRKNPTFEIQGHRFTKQQPFKVLSSDEAQRVIDAAEKIGGGFRIATPSEARSYFG